VRLDSFAKTNLYLSVRPRRRDNYHGITSVFQRISLKDTIGITPRKDSRIKITTNNRKLACDSSNFAWQAADILRKRAGLGRGVNIHITKRIPLGSGMGGGSSNAACVLLGLNRLWKLKFSLRELAKIGAKIGSDVPFFIYGCHFAVVRGRGEKIFPLNGLKKRILWQVIAVPPVNVPTKLIYQKWDELKSLRLTTAESGVKLISLALRNNDLFLLNRAIYNGLEPVTSSLFPQVRRVIEELHAHGAQLIMMSGSGPAVFGIVSSKKEAVVLSRRVKDENPFWKVFLARTC